MKRKRRIPDAVFEAGMWLLFFALLVPAGIVGYVIGRDGDGQGGEAQRVTVSADGILVSAEAETIEAAPAFSVDDLMAEPKESWITNGGTLFNQRYSPLDEIDTSNVVGAQGCLASAPARLGRGREVLGRGAADRLRRRDLRRRPARTTSSRSTSRRADPLAVRGEARPEDQHCLLRLDSAAASRSATARCSSASSTAAWSPSTRRPARSPGRRRSDAGRRATRSPPRRSTTTAW